MATAPELATAETREIDSLIVGRAITGISAFARSEEGAESWI
jgi:hypothetical protein